MAELRKLDPRTLLANPDDPRRTAASAAMDDQLLASIKAVGIIQPPRVKETPSGLMIVTGGRRIKAAICAGLADIEVIVCDAEEAADAMRSVSENLVRAAMGSVDIWRAIESLATRGWNEQAIADALAQPVRQIRKLKLLSQLHPPMLEVMAAGSLPSEEQLRAIAAAPREEQAQVWKRHKPKKGHEVAWWEIARTLSKRRIPISSAKFDAELARAYGLVWEEDLFAPAGEDGRYTTNFEAFLGAQREWMASQLPERAVILTCDEHGRYQLPKKAQEVYGKPAKGDIVGYHLDPHSGEVKTKAYRMPEPKPAKPGKVGTARQQGDAPALPTSRPEVTQKGVAMIGDLRTDALHEALRVADIDDHTLIALLVLAIGGRNVHIDSGSDVGRIEREAAIASITEGGKLTADQAALVAAARTMLVSVLSCRVNRSDSGMVARVAGDALNAGRHLPNMATQEFLSCVSRGALEAAARAHGVRVEGRAKDTKAGMVERFKTGAYVYPGAAFHLTETEFADARVARTRPSMASVDWSTDDDNEASDLAADGNSLTDDQLSEAAD